MSAVAVVVESEVVRKTYGRDRWGRSAREVLAYSTLSWATPRLVAHGDGWIEVERCTPILDLPRRETVAHRDALWSLLQRVHDEGWWHGDASLVNVVLHPDRGPLMIDWENFTPATSDTSYDLHGALRAGVEPLWDTCGPEGVWWNGPNDYCPGAWWAWL